MAVLSAVSDTLYVPLLGRIYTSQYHASILHDPAALAIYDKLDAKIKAMPGQTEYASLASAVRSKNMDRYVQEFLLKHPEGIIINLGCGLETMHQRCDNGKAIWYELDLPEVLETRSQYIPQTHRDRYLPYSMFDYQWMDIVTEAVENPVLIIAAGLLIYFTEDEVLKLIQQLSSFPKAELLFDTVSAAGLKIARRMVSKMGKQEASMFFSVDDAYAFAAKLSPVVTVADQRPFYGAVDYSAGLAFSTRLRMVVSDTFNMVKTIHLHLY